MKGTWANKLLSPIYLVLLSVVLNLSSRLLDIPSRLYQVRMMLRVPLVKEQIPKTLYQIKTGYMNNPTNFKKIKLALSIFLNDFLTPRASESVFESRTEVKSIFLFHSFDLLQSFGSQSVKNITFWGLALFDCDLRIIMK